MADINVTQTAALRKDLKDRYGLEIDARITRVEFENSNKVRTYFRTDDSYVPPEAENPKTDQKQSPYELTIWDTKDDDKPSTMHFASLDGAMMGFAAMQRMNYVKIVLTEQGIIIQKYERK